MLRLPPRSSLRAITRLVTWRSGTWRPARSRRLATSPASSDGPHDAPDRPLAFGAAPATPPATICHARSGGRLPSEHACARIIFLRPHRGGDCGGLDKAPRRRAVGAGRSVLSG